MRQNAREILLDPSEYKEIKAASLNALTQFGDKAVGDDQTLIKQVSKMSSKAAPMVKQSARRFLNKYAK